MFPFKSNLEFPPDGDAFNKMIHQQGIMNSLWLCKDDVVFEKKITLVHYWLSIYTLAMYMGYITEPGFTRFGCCNIATFGIGGQGVLYPSIWVAV